MSAEALAIEAQKQKSETQESRRGSELLRRLKLAGAIGMTAMSGLVGIGGQVYSGDVLMGPKIAIEYITGETAPTPSDAELASAAKALMSPPPPTISLAKEAKSLHETEEAAYYRYLEVQAANAGLHLPDTLRAFKEINEAKSYEQVMQAVNEFTATSGFAVNVDTSHDIKDWFMQTRAVNPSALEAISRNPHLLKEYKKDMSGLVGELGLVPVELLHNIGLKEIRLVEGFDNSKVGGYANPISGVLYLSGSEIADSPSGVLHELGHFIDARADGIRGMDHDPSFLRINGANFHYGSFKTSEEGKIVVSKYATTNVLEDKAEIFRRILDGGIKEYIQGRPLQDKTVELLARIEKICPGYEQYFYHLINVKL